MSDVNWNNVVSAVATEEGLLVTERGADGTVGASPRLLPYGYDWSGRQTNAGTRLPTPPEFDNRFPPSKPICTDAGLKTYRTVGMFPNGKYPSALFKACSDQDAWNIAVPAWQQNKNLGFCLLLERLDAKPGYVSAWTVVKSTMDCNIS